MQFGSTPTQWCHRKRNPVFWVNIHILYINMSSGCAAVTLCLSRSVPQSDCPFKLWLGCLLMLDYRTVVLHALLNLWAYVDCGDMCDIV